MFKHDNPVVFGRGTANHYELEYSVRIKGSEFEPWVFSDDIFTVRVGYPEKEEWQEMENVKTLLRKTGKN